MDNSYVITLAFWPSSPPAKVVVDSLRELGIPLGHQDGAGISRVLYRTDSELRALDVTFDDRQAAAGRLDRVLASLRSAGTNYVVQQGETNATTRVANWFQASENAERTFTAGAESVLPAGDPESFERCETAAEILEDVHRWLRLPLSNHERKV